MPSKTELAILAVLAAVTVFYTVRAFVTPAFRWIAPAVSCAVVSAFYSVPLFTAAQPRGWVFPAVLLVAIAVASVCLAVGRDERTVIEIPKSPRAFAPAGAALPAPAGAQPRPPAPSFTGNLVGIPLVDVLQLIGLGQKSGTLLVVLDRGRFSLSFVRGMLVEAEAVPFRPTRETGGRPRLVAVPPRAAADHSAQLARVVRGLLRLQSGVFNFQQTTDVTEPPAHAVGVESLLLDALREEDEARDRATA